MVGGLGAYVVFSRGSKGGVTETITGGDQPFSGTLKAAVAMGVPMKCSYTVEGAEYEGYVKGQNYKGEINVDGKMGSVIMKDNCMWSWEEGAKQGMKTCFEFEDENETIWDSPDTENLGAAYNYTCRPVAITDDKFSPPSEVEFIDLDEMMNNLGDLVPDSEE